MVGIFGHMFVFGHYLGLPIQSIFILDLLNLEPSKRSTQRLLGQPPLSSNAGLWWAADVSGDFRGRQTLDDSTAGAVGVLRGHEVVVVVATRGQQHVPRTGAGL